MQQPSYDNADVTIYAGDSRVVLAALPVNSVQCCVTSPPYWGLRDYGTAEWEGGDPNCKHEGSDVRTGAPGSAKQASNKGANSVATVACRHCSAHRVDSQIGLEETTEEYVAALVKVFEHVRRVMRDDGTLWLNLGDSYASTSKGGGVSVFQNSNVGARFNPVKMKLGAGLKAKDLVGIPWMTAFALRAAGWYLRSEIIWHKPNPMPESVTDRPTKSHEQIFLFAKSEHYYYDADAIAEKCVGGWNGSTFTGDRDIAVRPTTGKTRTDDGRGSASRWDERKALGEGPRCGFSQNAPNNATSVDPGNDTRNKRSVWTVPTKPFAEAHFATFPPDLIRPCILAGCPAGGVVLDPFSGAGTTALVAKENGRRFVGCELNPEYIEIAARRLAQGTLFND